MKSLPISLLLWLLAAALSPAVALTADQKITAVTVYPDRALVTRSGSVTLDTGVQTVVFDNLPATLEEDSVRVKGSGAGRLKILGVEVRRDYKEVAVSPAMKQLQDAIDKNDDQQRTLNDEAEDNHHRQEFLDDMRGKVTTPTAAGDAKDPTLSVQAMQGFFTLYGNESGKISNRWREIQFALRDLAKQRADLAAQLSLLQKPAEPNTRSAVVTVEATDPGAASLQVTYLMPGASWQPQYDAYADPDTHQVELTYYGVVRQTTGENWDNVALTLSSARPTAAARLPELPAWTIDFTGDITPMNDVFGLDLARSKAVSDQAQPSLSIANSTANVPAPDEATPALAAAQPVDATMQTAEVRTLGPSATFLVPAKTSIPSDDQPHRNAISVQALKGEWTYEATPKLVASAFLKTRVTNTSSGPLLGGDINTFLGKDFIGKSYIGLVAANASFDLFLGADDNIKVTRTEGVKKEEVGGILTRMKIYKRSFTIEVQNFKDTAATFQLRDQLPVSKNGQISVVVDKAEPAFKSRDENTGEVNWEIKLAPNEKQKLTVEYEIDAPYTQSVAGL
jgi:uncharacterized protein (TIGR02231 family)